MPERPFSSRQLAYLSPWLVDTSSARMESLGITGGFSGAVIWRVSLAGDGTNLDDPSHVDTGREPLRHGHPGHGHPGHRHPGHWDLCLRRWPQVHPSLTGLQAIHGLLQHVAAAGCDIVPVPIATRYGETYFVHEEHLWELTHWMPGEASFRRDPTSGKLAAAMQALAQFHQAAQAYDFQGSAACLGPSPGLKHRLAMIQRLQQGELQQLWQATSAAEASDLRELAFELLEGIGYSLDATAINLKGIVDVPLPLQWCLRDVRHDHVLFTASPSTGERATAERATGERVSGLLDFGAVAVDSVAGDLARLLGSIVDDQCENWQTGIEAYGRERQLSLAERQAIVGFDHGGLICSATNWVRWLFVEGRSFPQIHALHAQLLWLRDRLQALASRSTASVAEQLSAPTWRQSPHPPPQAPSAGGGGGRHRANVSPWMHT